jgi:hypothetical protein
MSDLDLLETVQPVLPSTRLLWSAIVDVDQRQDLGPSQAGHRFRVPILGGRFVSGPEFDRLNGRVLPGGADSQLLRTDGVKELDAVYEMKLDDGPILHIRNRVVVDETRQPERYAMSVITVGVENGPYAWLSRRLIIGTLQSARPTRQAVIIRAWEADTFGSPTA